MFGRKHLIDHMQELRHVERLSSDKYSPPIAATAPGGPGSRPR